jgi:hypothetical protein
MDNTAYYVVYRAISRIKPLIIQGMHEITQIGIVVKSRILMVRCIDKVRQESLTRCPPAPLNITIFAIAML